MVNTGTIDSAHVQLGDVGVYLGTDSALENEGYISDATAIYMAPDAYVLNAGELDADVGMYAIYATGQDTLEALPGAQFSGLVDDIAQEGTLVLSGTKSGSLDLNRSFYGFNNVIFTAGAKWQVEGDIYNLAMGQTISGITYGDTIHLDGFTATSRAYVPGEGVILSNHSAQITIDLTGDFSSDEILIEGTDKGTDITAPCFVRGTRIATAKGNVPVEHLQIGDLIKTSTRGMQPIRWIGTRSYDGRFIAGNHSALPIRIRRHAFGFNIPSRDLYLSPDHAVCEGGVLVHASRFLNDVSVTQLHSVEHIDYFHIELDYHAVIFAENTPVESFLDVGCRNRFSNATTAPQPNSRATCLPRVEDGYYLERLKLRIDLRAGIKARSLLVGELQGNIDRVHPILEGWARDIAAPGAAVELELVQNDNVILKFLANRYRNDLRLAGVGSGCHAFQVTLPQSLTGAFEIRRAADGEVLGSWLHSRDAA
jgi:hypothetical protein